MSPLDQFRLNSMILMMPKLHTWLSQQFPQALWAGNPHRREIALTFDDGPHPHDTPRLLDLLAKHEVTATFFHLGRRVETFPHLVGDVAAAGHQIGLHGYRHYPFPLELPQRLHRQLDRTRLLMGAACNCDPATLRDVRPPYGLFTPGILDRLIDWGYRPVLWSLVPFHWQQPAEVTLEQINRQAKAGSLLVLHEGLSGPPIAMLAGTIISRLKAANFRFVTVSQMWQAGI